MSESKRLPWFHFVANRLLSLLLPRALILKIEGLEYVPPDGPVIGAFNHTSFIDPVLAAAYTRWDVLPMAKVELFRFPLNLIFGGYGAFAVRRGEGDLGALRQALRILHDRHVMLISPEGTRTKSGVLESAREGTALIAIKSGAPILPIAIWGGKQFWVNLKQLRRTRVGMRIGEPLRIVVPPGKPNRQLLRQISDELMYYIARLLPPEYHGVYSDVDNIVPRYVFPARQVGQSESEQEQMEVMSMR